MDRKNVEGLYQAVTLGLLFPVSIGVGFFLGRWLDGVFGTRPWLAVVFTVCGVAAAFVNLFRAGKTSGGGNSEG